MTAQTGTLKVQVDVWNGEYSEDHVARYLADLNVANDVARIIHELETGCLINLLSVEHIQARSWRDSDSFDLRQRRVQ